MFRSRSLRHPSRWALFAALALLALGVFAFHTWKLERDARLQRECTARGGLWTGTCRPGHDACYVGDHRKLPVGVVYGNGCNTCECGPNYQRCTSVWCKTLRDGADPSCKFAVFDPGCEAPQSFCGRGGATFRQRAYCGCDGVTFTSDAPLKPYRHLGPCE